MSKPLLPHEANALHKSLRFDCTPVEMAAIQQIAARYAWLVECNSRPTAPKIDTFDTAMVIAAVHCNDTPLDLSALLQAPAQAMYNEVYTFVQTLDRLTGKLQGFTPRFRRL